jgi:hypothetical protein
MKSIKVSRCSVRTVVAPEIVRQVTSLRATQATRFLRYYLAKANTEALSFFLFEEPSYFILRIKFRRQVNYCNHHPPLLPSDQGSLIAWLEVPTHVATSHNTALPGHHRADNNFSVSWRDLEIQIQPFYEFERRKELDGGAVGWGVLLHHEKRLFANHRGGDDAIVIFRVSELGVFGRGHTT